MFLKVENLVVIFIGFLGVIKVNNKVRQSLAIGIAEYVFQDVFTNFASFIDFITFITP